MTNYIFDDAETQRELTRLRAIEAIFDPKTHLEAPGDWTGRSGDWFRNPQHHGNPRV